jgi:flagellar hook-length control protein FliK
VDPAGAPISVPTADTPAPGVKVPVLSVQHSPLPKVQVLPDAAKMDGSVFNQDVVGRALSRVERLQTLVENMDRYILSAVSSRDKSMTMTLIPETLGKVVLNCREENGRIWVDIQTSNPAARDLLMRNEEAIRNLMDQAGYKLAQFGVRGETANENSGFFQKQQGQYREESDARPEPEPPVNPPRAQRGAGAPISARQRGIWVVA